MEVGRYPRRGKETGNAPFSKFEKGERKILNGLNKEVHNLLKALLALTAMAGSVYLIGCQREASAQSSVMNQSLQAENSTNIEQKRSF